MPVGEQRASAKVVEVRTVGCAAVDAEGANLPYTGQRQQAHRSLRTEVGGFNHRAWRLASGGRAQVVPQQPALAGQGAQHRMGLDQLTQRARTWPVVDVRIPGEHHVVRLPTQRLAAGVYHVEVDDVRQPDCLLAYRVVEAEEAIARQVVAVPQGKGRALAENEPRLISLLVLAEPVEKVLHARSIRGLCPDLYRPAQAVEQSLPLVGDRREEPVALDQPLSRGHVPTAL